MTKGWIEDLYFKKQIDYAFYGEKFRFDTGELLFSTLTIDTGTQFLLRHMYQAFGSPTTILDLGCGYGVIGIVLARFHPRAHVVLSDKDLLAVRYSSHNLELNNITNAKVVASIGVECLPLQNYDLIVSNIPGHIGDRAIELDFVLKPIQKLYSKGVYWFVIVAPLTSLIKEICTRHNLQLEQIGSRADHSVFKITKAS